VLGVQTQSGSINLNGVVPGPAPTIPAVIVTPVNDTRTADQVITVSGTCSPGLLVKIFKNGIFAGSTTCSGSGTFSLQIALLPGRNDLTALNYDSLDQPGPVSPTVVVYLLEPDSGDVDGDGNTTELVGSETSQPITSHTTPLPASAFYVSTDYELRGLKKDQSFSWKLSIVGGTGPYSLVIDWGDGSKDTQTVTQSGLLNLQHTYKQSGPHTITITATDAQNHKTYLELIAVVDGQPETAVVPGAGTTTSNGPDYWMLSSIAAYSLLMVGLIWFWLFERHKRNHPHNV
jgi:hypothetical protein